MEFQLLLLPGLKMSQAFHTCFYCCSSTAHASGMKGGKQGSLHVLEMWRMQPTRAIRICHTMHTQAAIDTHKPSIKTKQKNTESGWWQTYLDTDKYYIQYVFLLLFWFNFFSDNTTKWGQGLNPETDSRVLMAVSCTGLAYNHFPWCSSVAAVDHRSVSFLIH